MSILNELAHTAVRNSRRVAGRVKATQASVDGIAPTAVLTAIKKASLGRPSSAERAWIHRIELMRALLTTSTAPLAIEDFGAGAGHKFDIDGNPVTRHMVSKTLGAMTGSSKPPRWAYLLFRLVRELQPPTAIEMGACVGISASYEAAALELNGTGRLISLEGADVLADRSTHTLTELQLAHRADVRLGRFTDTLDTAIHDLTPVGFAFIDGHHVETATIDYMNQLLPHLTPEAVIVFDDINWSDGMRNAWHTITTHPAFALTVNLGSVGIAATSATNTHRQNLTIPYY